MTSTCAPERTRALPRRAARSLLVLAFWVLVWQLVALAVGHEILLASPVAVLRRLGELALTGEFWVTVGTSLLRISGGFVAGSVLGVLGAILAARSRVAEALLAPLVRTVRSVPVVSFIILALIWAGSAALPVVVAAIIVAPVVHTNVLQGIRSRDRALLEVAEVFEMGWWARWRAIDLPAVGPYLAAASQTGVGLAWKSGVAAEVIGLTDGSIGEQLYQAKLFLSTADVLAWTVMIVVLSFAVERLALAPVRRLVPLAPATAGGPR